MKVKSITYKEAEKLIEDIGISTVCDQCGSPKSAMLSRTFGDTEFVELGTLETVCENGTEGFNGRFRCTYKTLPVICSRCGHIRHFLLEQLLSDEGE